MMALALMVSALVLYVHIQADYHFRPVFIMSWNRAVWNEGGKVVKGVLSTNWIKGQLVYWLKRNPQSMAKAHAAPAENWLKFPLVKMKHSAGLLFINIF
jgi:hypothetical protein